MPLQPKMYNSYGLRLYIYIYMYIYIYKCPSKFHGSSPVGFMEDPWMEFLATNRGWGWNGPKKTQKGHQTIGRNSTVEFRSDVSSMILPAL